MEIITHSIIKKINRPLYFLFFGLVLGIIFKNNSYAVHPFVSGDGVPVGGYYECKQCGGVHIHEPGIRFFPIQEGFEGKDPKESFPCAIAQEEARKQDFLNSVPKYFNQYKNSNNLNDLKQIAIAVSSFSAGQIVPILKKLFDHEENQSAKILLAFLLIFKESNSYEFNRFLNQYGWSEIRINSFKKRKIQFIGSGNKEDFFWMDVLPEQIVNQLDQIYRSGGIEYRSRF